MKKRLFFLIPFMLLIRTNISGQTQVYLYNTDYFMLYSEIVLDTFHVQVSLPFNYAGSSDSYPVIYLLDSDRMFGFTHDIVHWLNFSREIPDAIVVGVAYKKDWWQKRARDYTPTQDRSNIWGDWPLAGGADNFILFITNELTPALSKFRIDHANKTVVGLSLGGVFASYALFSNPGLFDNYLMISPALLWDYEYILNMDQKFKEGLTKKVKVFTSVGSLDNENMIIIPWIHMNDSIVEMEYPNLIWEQRMYEGQGHISVLPVALTDGLKFLLND